MRGSLSGVERTRALVDVSSRRDEGTNESTRLKLTEHGLNHSHKCTTASALKTSTCSYRYPPGVPSASDLDRADAALTRFVAGSREKRPSRYNVTRYSATRLRS